MEVSLKLVTVWMYVSAVFALVNTLLIIILLWMYTSSFRRIRSSFSAGLLVFVVFFLAQNISIIVLWYQLFSASSVASTIVDTAAPYMSLINIVETVALASLVKVSME